MRKVTIKVKPRDADWFEQELLRENLILVRHNFKTVVNLIVTIADDDQFVALSRWFMAASERRKLLRNA